MTEEPESAGRGGLVRITISMLIAIALVVWIYSAWPRPEPGLAKIEFALKQLDDEGLYGPPDGKVARNYEFCIPDTPETIAEVRAIDGTAEVSDSPGRIGCGTGQVLVIGNTARTNWLDVLRSLTRLDYVHRIVASWAE